MRRQFYGAIPDPAQHPLPPPDSVGWAQSRARPSADLAAGACPRLAAVADSGWWRRGWARRRAHMGWC